MIINEFVPVESSNLAAVKWEPTEGGKGLLSVKFKVTNAVYEYWDVPKDLYKELLEAESKGKYFNSIIKARFAAKKVS